MNDKPIVIAVLDDEAKMCLALARLLHSHGYEVALFDSGAAFLAAEPHFDCVLLDLNMPGMSGLDVMRALDSNKPRPSVIVITGRDEPGNEEQLIELGARAYLLKPVDETALLEAIESSLPARADRH